MNRTDVICGAVLSLALAGAFRLAAAQPPAADPDQALYDMLMILDILAAPDPVVPEPGAAAPAEEEAEEELVIDEVWMLSMIEALADDAALEQERSADQLRAALLQLRRLEAAAEGDTRSALDAAATKMARWLEAVETLQPVPPTLFRYTIAEAQYAIALFHCKQADQRPRGTLAHPEPSMRQRLDHLATAAQYLRQASLTARYRVPEPVKRSLAASVAMSRLFDTDEVQLRQVRLRARELETALEDLARAIRRATP